jgi:hypothetical protein
MGPISYYFPDPQGLSFFDRLEDRTNDTSGSPTNARMSTFLFYDVLSQDHGNNNNISMIDHEYFSDTPGYTIKVNGTVVKTPYGNSFMISSNYKSYIGLSNY